MVKNFFLSVVLAIIACISLNCCSFIQESQSVPYTFKRYNICLILDGTDRLSTQNGVPIVSAEQLVDLARKLSDKGVGSLYVSYVDSDCDNNQIALFEWWQEKPEDLKNKPDYMKVTDYIDLKVKKDEEFNVYNTALEDELDRFARKCNALVETAYSDAVAKGKKGSDINGAINQAFRMLRASEQESNNYVILISDGVDNIGKKLSDSPPSATVMIVNSNVTKHKLDGVVSKEYVTLNQASNHIFMND